MTERKWSNKVLFRYILIQLPGLLFLIFILLLIHRWVKFPVWIIWMVGFISTVIDVVLFFFTWSAYDWESKDTLIGETGEAINLIDRKGYIRIHGEQWKAERIDKGPPIEKGEKVIVQGREGLTLHIQAYPKK